MSSAPLERKAVQDRIRACLRSRLGLSEDRLAGCGGDTPLLGRGLGLDSVEAMTLAAGLEQEFDLVIEDDELTAELFSSLNRLTDFILDRHDA